MTVYTPFRPPATHPMRFTISAARKTLFVTVPYNLYSNRYYLKITDGSNKVVLYTPMIASPDGYDINMIIPYAPAKLVYRASTNNFESS